jgi:magnesium transporter
MLTAYSTSARTEAADVARKVSWLDLLDPTNEERAGVESKFGLALPSREALSEVESSSRISEENGVLFLSMPIV